jgi:hypothetical protein
MANKIQNFDTGEKDNSNIIHLDLDPKINIENKIYFKNLLKKIAECSLDDLEEEYVDTLRKKWIETYRIGF